MTNEKKELLKLRADIDNIDNKILKLLTKRFRVVEKIKLIKKKLKIKLKDKNREDKILKKANNFSKEYGSYLKNIYKTILKNSLEVQK